MVRVKIVDMAEIHRPVRDRRTRDRKGRSDSTTHPQSRVARRPDDAAASMNVARIRPRKRWRSDDNLINGQLHDRLRDFDYKHFIFVIVKVFVIWPNFQYFSLFSPTVFLENAPLCSQPKDPSSKAYKVSDSLVSGPVVLDIASCTNERSEN